MITLQLTRKADVPRPMGNPFVVYPYEVVVETHTPYIDTGIHIDLPDDFTLMIEPLVPGFVFGWRMDETLKVAMSCFDGHTMDVSFAKVTIVERQIVPVRFAEVNTEGKRVITGEPRETHESSDSIRSTES